ncbi:hypothetical protein AHF37_08192, partial [Paragonimus kellicotti]
PFERTIVVNKSSSGDLGVSIDDGLIKAIHKDSSAARNGLLTDHQIVEVDGQNVLGLKDKQLKELLQRCGSSVRLTIVPYSIYKHMVKRPFERTIVVNKSSSGDLGVSIDDGLIKAIHKDSSAARNGLLTDHQIVEVDGQNVLGLKDKQLKELLQRCGSSVRLTIVPYSIYKHMVKR